MKIAIIGSRNLNIDISSIVPAETTEIITGGARGVDTAAERYADAHGIYKTVIRPDYEQFGSRAPLIRNREIVNQADLVIAVWDGESRGTKYTMQYARKIGKPLRVFQWKPL